MRSLLVAQVFIAALVIVASACTSAPRTPATPTQRPAAQTTSVSPPAAVQTSIDQTAAAATPVVGDWSIVGFSFVGNTEGWLLRQNNVRMQVLRTTDAGDSWHIQYDATDPVASTIQFLDAMHGWVGGITGGPECHDQLDRIVEACQGAVLATSDGGTTWRLTSPTTLAITSVNFVSAGTGWALAQRHCNACATNPIDVLRSSDAGASWTTSELPGSEQEPTAQLAAIDATHAIVVTGSVESTPSTPAGGTEWTTDDAGVTWQSPAPSPCSHNDAAFPAPELAQLTMLDAHTGWAICADGAAAGMRGSNLYQTQDDGMTWALISEYGTTPAHPVPGVGIFPGGDGELRFFDDLRGWYATDEMVGSVFRTDDGGHTWHGLPDVLSGAPLQFVQFVNDTDGWIATAERLAHTADAGTHWTLVELPK